MRQRLRRHTEPIPRSRQVAAVHIRAPGLASIELKRKLLRSWLTAMNVSLRRTGKCIWDSASKARGVLGLEAAAYHLSDYVDFVDFT